MGCLLLVNLSSSVCMTNMLVKLFNNNNKKSWGRLFTATELFIAYLYGMSVKLLKKNSWGRLFTAAELLIAYLYDEHVGQTTKQTSWRRWFIAS